MKKYSVRISKEAKAELKEYLWYIRDKYQSRQAMGAIREDYKQTIRILESSAGSLPECDNEHLRKLGIKKIRFQKHRYVMLYTLDETTATATVIEIHHELEDYENKIR